MNQTPWTAEAGEPAAITGQVVYLFAFDLAYELTRVDFRELMGKPVEPLRVTPSKRQPRQVIFHQSKVIHLDAVDRVAPQGKLRLERTVKILAIGAISLAVKVPFNVNRLEDLVAFHDLQFANGQSLQREVTQWAEEIRRELSPYCLRPVRELGDVEAYTVFCLESPLQDAQGRGLSAEGFLRTSRRRIAALLTEETDPAHLSEQEAMESTGRSLSYYDLDLAIIDWDAALLLDARAYWEDTLYIMELANLQLAELEAYDRMLDGVIERAYRDLSGHGSGSRRRLQRELREIRIDLARVSDELENITKFFGDWHLARIYQALAERFHLADWHRTVEGKLKTLDELYQLLQHDRNNRWMMVLEVTVVLLFIIDLAMLFLRH